MGVTRGPASVRRPEAAGDCDDSPAGASTLWRKRVFGSGPLSEKEAEP